MTVTLYLVIRLRAACSRDWDHCPISKVHLKHSGVNIMPILSLLSGSDGWRLGAVLLSSLKLLKVVPQWQIGK